MDDETAAEQFAKTTDEINKILEGSRSKLFEERAKRVAPGRDDKILVAWNGLMISAMSQAAEVLNHPEYSDAAASAAEFILQSMLDEQGRLLHGYKDGHAKHNAYLDDYACFIDGLVDLYQAKSEVKYLNAAIELANEMKTHFLDSASGGFFYTADDHEQLITRPADSQDGATPSGNAMAATALLRMGRLCARSEFEELAYGTLQRLSGQMNQYAMASGQALIALDFLIGPTYEFVVVDSSSDESELVCLLHQRFLPNKVLAFRPSKNSDGDNPPTLAATFRGKQAVNDEPTAYLCERGQCQSPTVGVQAFTEALDAL